MACSSFCDWLMQQISKIRNSRNRIEAHRDTDDDKTHSDFYLLLRGGYSIDPTIETKKFLFVVRKIRKSVVLEKSSWQLLSKRRVNDDGRICTKFPLSTKKFNNFCGPNLENSISCNSFAVVYESYADDTSFIYQIPIACPTYPARRLRIYRLADVECWRWIMAGQLRRGSTKLFCCWEQDVDEQSNIRIVRIMIYDWNRKLLETHFPIKIPFENTLYFCFADTSTTMIGDDRLKLIYLDNHIPNRSTAFVYECSTRDGGGHFQETRMVDTKTYDLLQADDNRRVYCQVNSWKSFDDEYFVWFVSTSGDFEKLQNLFCITYERDDDDDQIWKWSPDLVPFNKWAQETKYGQRLMRAVEMLKEIQPDDDELDLVRQIELKYREGQVFARTESGYLRRYAFRPPSLQSMAIDLVRRMIVEETVETKSLKKYYWWGRLVAAAGMFDLCPPDYGQ